MAFSPDFRSAARSPYWPILAVLTCLFVPATLLGQSGEADVGEASISGGGSFGAGSHPFVSGSSGIAFSRNAIALLEASYMPMGKEILWRRPDINSPQNSYLLDFGFDIHVRIPVRDRWAPYGILGAGLLFNSFRSVVGPEGSLIGVTGRDLCPHSGRVFSN